MAPVITLPTASVQAFMQAIQNMAASLAYYRTPKQRLFGNTESAQYD